MVIPTVIGPLGTIHKGSARGLVKLRISGRAKTISSTALLRSARILSRNLKT